MRYKWLFIFLPVAMGLVIRIVLAFGWLSNPTLFLRADLGTLALLTGIILSVLGGAGVLVWVRANQKRDRDTAYSQAEAAANRRRFLQRLDHELKNPLTAIQAGLANLNGLQNTDAEALESVKNQTQRLSRLVADLRKIAELETRPIEKTRVNLVETLEDALDLALEQSGEVERRLTLNLPQAPWPLPTITGDPDLLFLAIHNLLSNALKFTKPEDKIEVRAFEDGAMVVVEVADTGPGIPEGELPYVWQELYRGKGARGVPGSGLGLALVRAITERHSGQVNLRSRPGKGTVITLRLPIGDVLD